MATVDDKKIIFSMVGLTKSIRQTNKTILKNIYLSFFYGAKIGIIGLNGAGKSTLLKIIAGLDTTIRAKWSSLRAILWATFPKNRNSIRQRRCAKSYKKACSM